MYDFTLQKLDVDLAKVIYTASSDRMRFIYGIYGVLLVHWFFPEVIRQICNCLTNRVNHLNFQEINKLPKGLLHK